MLVSQIARVGMLVGQTAGVGRQGRSNSWGGKAAMLVSQKAAGRQVCWLVKQLV